MNDNEDLLYVAAYDVETDTSRLVCMPFSEIERVAAEIPRHTMGEQRSGTAA